jgi:hypothetical protein
LRGPGLAKVTKTATTARRNFRATLALLPLVAASACTSTGAPHGTSTPAPTSFSEHDAAQPAIATYACADGDVLTIRNLGTSIRLIGPNGMEGELPASPVNQRSRYGEAHDAIVLDGREALVMKGGKPPLTCTR